MGFRIMMATEDGTFPAEWEDWDDDGEPIFTTYDHQPEAEASLKKLRKAQIERELEAIERTAPDISPWDDCPPVHYFIKEV